MSKKDEIIDLLEKELNSHKSTLYVNTDHIGEKIEALLVLPTETVNDQMKSEFILENWEKITLEQLEGLV